MLFVNGKSVLINSYIKLNKIESLQKKAFRFLYNDYSISYEDLLEKPGKLKMGVNRLRNLCVEIQKTMNKLNPEIMNNIFKVKGNKRLVRKKYKLNLETPERNQVGNGLPFYIKTSENLIPFKSLIKKWNGNSCSCTVCTK